MRKTYTLILFVYLGSFNYASFAQNTLTDLITGNNESSTTESNTSRSCISESEYRIIEKRCAENKKLLRMGREENTTTTVSLGWPLQPSPNLTDCSYYHVSAYVDHNVNAGAIQDWNCGTNTYDGHKGTDIATWPFNFYKMDNDLVKIVAAAPGIIIDKHDGEFDRNCSSNNLTANYVIIQHADGSYALYWHMKNNSVTSLAIGQPVSAGDYLGVVGSSGSSSGPHLHFEVWTGNTSATMVDPFAGPCNTIPSSWWTAQKAYRETGVIKASVNTTDIVLPPCPATETLNESNSFQIPFQGPGMTPGYAKFYIFIRDEVSGLTADLKILNPNGSTYLSWTYNSTSTNNVRTWGWSKLLPVAPGRYTFQAVYNGITCSRNFDITNQTGIDDVNHFSATKIYPNPSDGKFTVETGNGNDQEIDIYNLLGEKIFQTKLADKKSEINLKVPGGVYFYQVKENNQFISRGKFVVH